MFLNDNVALSLWHHTYYLLSNLRSYPTPIVASKMTSTMYLSLFHFYLSSPESEQSCICMWIYRHHSSTLSSFVIIYFFNKL